MKKQGICGYRFKFIIFYFLSFFKANKNHAIKTPRDDQPSLGVL